MTCTGTTLVSTCKAAVVTACVFLFPQLQRCGQPLQVRVAQASKGTGAHHEVASCLSSLSLQLGTALSLEIAACKHLLSEGAMCGVGLLGHVEYVMGPRPGVLARSPDMAWRRMPQAAQNAFCDLIRC